MKLKPEPAESDWEVDMEELVRREDAHSEAWDMNATGLSIYRPHHFSFSFQSAMGLETKRHQADD